MMKKSIYFAFVLILVLSGLALNQADSKDKKQKNFVKVVYFHTDYRCATCTKLEKYSKEVVMKYYKQEKRDGNVVWETINYEEKENEHFVEEFNLYNKALIIMKYENGKLKEWKNLEAIWENVGDKTKYFDYVKKEIDKYMKG